MEEGKISERKKERAMNKAEIGKAICNECPDKDCDRFGCPFLEEILKKIEEGMPK